MPYYCLWVYAFAFFCLLPKWHLWLVFMAYNDDHCEWWISIIYKNKFIELIFAALYSPIETLLMVHTPSSITAKCKILTNEIKMKIKCVCIIFGHNAGMSTRIDFRMWSDSERKSRTSWATNKNGIKAQFALIFCRKSSVVLNVLLCWVKAIGMEKERKAWSELTLEKMKRKETKGFE